MMENDDKKAGIPPFASPLRKLVAGEELRYRTPTNRVSASTSDGLAAGARRASSNLSEYSLSDARKTLQSSTDDLLLPTPSPGGGRTSHESSHWDSAPLAFALLPAVGGMLFSNGSSVVTDIMLLGLAAIFLNWSVRLPWNWYKSAQSIREVEEYNSAAVEEDSEDDIHTLPDETSPAEPAPSSTSKSHGPLPHELATKELYTHEVLALLSCFLFPLLGAYLLHTIRAQLSRPSEGLVSNYNLTIFLLASELRPMSHLIKLVQARTLHLQRVVNSNPFDGPKEATKESSELLERLEALESRTSNGKPSGAQEPVLNGKQTALLTTDVRKTLQPELDALNRAVRRYEKRATLQAFQTESRLMDLEARLNDAISLAAAAVTNNEKQRGLFGAMFDWLTAAVLLPWQASVVLLSVPVKTAATLLNLSHIQAFGSHGPEKVKGSSGRRTPSRMGERPHRFGKR